MFYGLLRSRCIIAYDMHMVKEIRKVADGPAIMDSGIFHRTIPRRDSKILGILQCKNTLNGSWNLHQSFLASMVDGPKSQMESIRRRPYFLPLFLPPDLLPTLFPLVSINSLCICSVALG